MKGKTVAILVEDLYQEMEVWYPAYRLREAGVKTVFVGTGKPEYKSKLGYPVKAEAEAKEVKARDFDAVVIPGGYAPDILRRFDEVNRFGGSQPVDDDITLVVVQYTGTVEDSGRSDHTARGVAA